MIRFDRTALALGTLGLVGAAALTACRSEDSDAAAKAAEAANDPHAAATAAANEATNGAADAAAATNGTTPGLVWHDMDHEQREHFMKSVVLPHMKAEFAKWEPEEFTNMKCGACHGDGAKDHTFKMPNPKLPRLPTDEQGWKELEAKEPEAVKFMSEVVVPQMAQMLNEPRYDPVTKKGFGCFECHTAKK